MAFDIEGARKAGYSDAEIADQLSQRFGFDLAGAKSAGYSDGEVIAQLAKRPAPVRIPGQMAQAEPAAQPGVMDKIIGAGDAATTTLLNMAGGAVGMAGGAAAGLGKALYDKATGKPWNPNTVEDMAARGAQFLTAPAATEEGQRQADAIGNALAQTIPAAAALPGLRMPPGAVPAAAQALRTGAAATLDTARTAIPAAIREAPGRVAAAVSRAPTGATPGTMGSVGAAGTDMSAQRTATANNLPVPIRISKGEATRDPEQLTFEREAAKQAELGAPLRQHSADKNLGILQNFEAMIEQTGAVTTQLIETGRAVVDGALVPAAARAKNGYRVLYRQAEKAGEMEQPVGTAPLLQFLSENASMNAPELSGGTLGLLQRELLRLGGAEMVDGALVAREMTLGNVELLRRQIGNAIDAAPENATNMRTGVQARAIIDQITEGMGGNLYKQARAARRRYAQLFEDNAIVANLLKTRRGTADRQVALENVFRSTVLAGSRESLGMLRRTLQVAGGPEGQQAWRELQGATLQWIRSESTKSATPDMMGNKQVSAHGLNSAITTLDASGKLEFMFGRQGAQRLRDLNEIAADLLTLPREAWVNSSNTAAVFAATVDAILMGGGTPAPVVTMARMGIKQIKDSRLRRRINDALNNAQKQAPNNAPADPVELPGQPGPTVH